MWQWPGKSLEFNNIDKTKIHEKEKNCEIPSTNMKHPMTTY